MNKNIDTKSGKDKVIQQLLKAMAQAILWRHNPMIIGVTGSVGKTSAKDAIAHVLSGSFDVRETYANYNNEIGVPLTIIGARTGGSSIFGWLKVFCVWVQKMTLSKYPEILVLEYGIDRPGDMDVLMDIASPSIAVVTNISGSHREFFSDLGVIAIEKGRMVERISCNVDSSLPCAAVLNADDKRVAAMERKTQKAVYTYGQSVDSDFTASHITSGDGMSFKLEIDARSVPVRLPNIVGEHNLSAVLAAIGVAQLFKVNLVEIAQRLLDYTTPPGRMRLLPGKGDTSIIDDTYNSSPVSAQAAIDALAVFSASRRIAVMGDMLEQGDEELKIHEKLGTHIGESSIDIVIAVGHRSAHMEKSLVKAGHILGETLFLVDTPVEARDFAQHLLQKGDVVLVKGSQGIRLEIVTEGLLAEDVNPGEVLCRQDETWKSRGFVQP